MPVLDGFQKAREHILPNKTPAPNFFEGALIGNGALGAVVCTRPDSVVLRLGHNNVWDIRIEEGHKDNLLTFKDVFEKMKAIRGKVKENRWYNDYLKNSISSYKKYKYPRPFPCGSVYFFFDRKKYELLGHTLDISIGLVTICFLKNNVEKVSAKVFVSQIDDTIHILTVNSKDIPITVFNRIRLEPEIDIGIPHYDVVHDDHILQFKQLMPGNDFSGIPRSEIDKGFSICVVGNRIGGKSSELNHHITQCSKVIIILKQGFYTTLNNNETYDIDYLQNAFNDTLIANEVIWRKYWSKSSIATDDTFLERIWYTNIYFMKCILNPTANCPGIYGNWMYGNIGTMWHGDYHMNYNTQQLFWGVFSSNRIESHIPYINLIKFILPISRKWANDFYQLNGVCIPHIAYPVEMTVNPYPSPCWGWEIFETPWAVQSLWWHYAYTKDLDLLKNCLFSIIKEAVLFITEYIKREDANPFNDKCYHIFPTVVPELYEITENFEKNIDGIADITLCKFLLKIYLEAVKVLDLEKEEKQLINIICDILSHFPEYPIGETESGTVFLSVKSEDTNTIYNVPTNLIPVFPGEDIDMYSEHRVLNIAKRTWKEHNNEGGNDLVFYHLQGARLGILDIEKFKRHILYCLLPNNTASNRVLMTGGRYKDHQDFDYMINMGIWIENFSLYAVINECFIHGHSDIITLFPNWDMNVSASFSTLRTKGAFLVTAACSKGEINYVNILSEKGGTLKIKNPWEKGALIDGKAYIENIIEFETVSNQLISFIKLI